ncbi:hypothetical protein AAZX31_08G242700 [Glycine max]|nr:hypothetical protein GYH30_022317 [Glycine max]
MGSFGLRLEYETHTLNPLLDPSNSIHMLIRSQLFRLTSMFAKSPTSLKTTLFKSTPTWFPLRSLNSMTISVSNSTATKPPPPLRPRNPPASPMVSSSDERTKVRPPPIEEGLRLVTKKEKNVVKLAGKRFPGCRNLTGRE